MSAKECPDATSPTIVTHGNSHPPDTGLAAHNLRIERDSGKLVHSSNHTRKKEDFISEIPQLHQIYS